MHSAQPLEILADELGAAAGRIERELRLKDEARAARFEARLVAIELAAFRAEEERQRIFAERLAQLRDGRDGEPGKDGKDADIGPIMDEFRAQKEVLINWQSDVVIEIENKLASLKDGKDGEPGRDGKDADIGPLREELKQACAALKADAEEQVKAALSTVRNGKDGKDGEPGKDADIAPLILEIREQENGLSSRINTSLNSLSERIDKRLAEVRNGEDGKPGDPGPPGKDGKLPIAREWTNRVHYAGDVVRHNGATYQALADTGSEPPHSDWGELASRGTDGIGFVLRGTYDAATEYKQHDIVMINRNSFAAKYDSPGECPGDGWQLFAASGQRGKEGPPGGKGADGRSVSIAKLEADPDAMVLRLTDSLGKTFDLDLEPIAERIIEAAR